jgi:hypothetical protein
MARDGNDAKSLWSAGKAVKIYAAPAGAKDRPAAGAETEKAGQSKRTCPCSKKS